MKITPDVQTQKALREAWVREQTGHPLPFLAAVARVCIVSKTQELSRQPASADELGGRSTHDRSRLSDTQETRHDGGTGKSRETGLVFPDHSCPLSILHHVVSIIHLSKTPAACTD